jgi:hypothetical protein
MNTYEPVAIEENRVNYEVEQDPTCDGEFLEQCMMGSAFCVWLIITIVVCVLISVGCNGNRLWADKQPGYVSPDFKREIITARRDFRR